jgi:hypothetical protein
MQAFAIMLHTLYIFVECYGGQNYFTDPELCGSLSASMQLFIPFLCISKNNVDVLYLMTACIRNCLYLMITKLVTIGPQFD